MKPQPTAPSYAGEVTVTLGGQARTFMLGINTLRDYTSLTNTPAGGLAKDFADDLSTTMVNLVFVAVKRYTPAEQLPTDFSVDHVGDWIDRMSDADGEILAKAVLHSIRKANPLTTALVAQLVPVMNVLPEGTDGMTSSTSPSVS